MNLTNIHLMIKTLGWLSTLGILTLKGYYEFVLFGHEVDTSIVITFLIMYVTCISLIHMQSKSETDWRNNITILLTPLTGFAYKMVTTEIIQKDWVLNWGPFKWRRVYDNEEIAEYLKSKIKITDSYKLDEKTLKDIIDKAGGSINKANEQLKKKIQEHATELANSRLEQDKSDTTAKVIWNSTTELLNNEYLIKAGVGLVFVMGAWWSISMIANYCGITKLIQITGAVNGTISGVSSTIYYKSKAIFLGAEKKEIDITKDELAAMIAHLQGQVTENSQSIQIMWATLSWTLTWLYENDGLDEWIQQQGGIDALKPVIRELIDNIRKR